MVDDGSPWPLGEKIADTVDSLLVIEDWLQEEHIDDNAVANCRSIITGLTATSEAAPESPSVTSLRGVAYHQLGRLQRGRERRHRDTKLNALMSFVESG